MKTMTFGTVPSFEEFAGAFCDGTVGIGHYSMGLVGTDLANMHAAGLVNRANSSYRHMSGRVQCEFSAQGLYSLVECLTELYEVDDDADYAAWAGDFASSILTILGFEWV